MDGEWNRWNSYSSDHHSLNMENQNDSGNIWRAADGVIDKEVDLELKEIVQAVLWSLAKTGSQTGTAATDKM